MPKVLCRAIAILLVPCLLTDRAVAIAMSPVQATSKAFFEAQAITPPPSVPQYFGQFFGVPMRVEIKQLLGDRQFHQGGTDFTLMAEGVTAYFRLRRQFAA